MERHMVYGWPYPCEGWILCDHHLDRPSCSSGKSFVGKCFSTWKEMVSFLHKFAKAVVLSHYTLKSKWQAEMVAKKTLMVHKDLPLSNLDMCVEFLSYYKQDVFKISVKLCFLTLVTTGEMRQCGRYPSKTQIGSWLGQCVSAKKCIFVPQGEDLW